MTPASTKSITSLEAYYALKNPVSYGRAWRNARAVRQGSTWVAEMPVLNVDDYVFAFANIRYANDIVLSSDFLAVVPSKLGAAVATDKPSNNLSEHTAAWSNTAPVEGVGGIRGFRVLHKRGTLNEQFSDPKYKAPPDVRLSFK